jgi:hypothetical protein
MPGYFGPSTPNHNVQPAKVVTMFGTTLTRANLEKMTRSVGVVLNAKRFGKTTYKRKGTDTITIIFAKPAGKVKMVGNITAYATSKIATTAECLAEAALAAMNIGADTLFVTAEGFSKELSSFGWGIGLAWTRATISEDQRSGGVGSGGFGISGGSAGYKDKPWLQTFALVTK